MTLIAPVVGTVAIDKCRPKRPVPVIHFHGTDDTFVRFEAAKGKMLSFVTLRGVEDSIQTWVKLNGCEEKPETDVLSPELVATKNSARTLDAGDGSMVQ